MTDRPEIVRPQSSGSGFNINDLVLSLPGTTGKRKESEEFYQRMGLGSPESLLGLVSADDKDKKYSVPKHLAEAVEKLDDDNQDTREQGSRELKKNASLKQLVDIRYNVEGITEEQRKRLNDLIKVKAEEKWKECGGDPRKLGKEFRDGKMAEVLVLHAPTELKDCVDTDKEFKEFMATRHAAKDYEKRLDKLGRIAAFSEMVERVAAKDDAGKEVRDLATEHKKHSVWHHAKAFAMDIHRRLARPYSESVSDWDEIQRETRDAHAQAARRLYMEIIDSGKYSVGHEAFRDRTRRFLIDEDADNKLYAKTVEKLTGKVLAEPGDASSPLKQKNQIDLMVLFGEILYGRGATAYGDKRDELGKQFERLSAAIEKRVASIKDPKERFTEERELIYTYMRIEHRLKANAMYKKALKTIELLPEKERKKELEDLKGWEKELGW